MKKSAMFHAICSLSLSLLMDIILDTYYWITTYVPIYARRLYLLFLWDVLPYIRKSLPVIKNHFHHFLIAAAGILFTILIYTLSALIHLSRSLAQGWRFRSALIAEYR